MLISARHRRRGVGLRLPELLRLRIALAPFFSGPSPNSFCSLLDGLACQNALVMGCLLPTAAADASPPRFGGIMSKWLARKCHFSVTIKGQS